MSNPEDELQRLHRLFEQQEEELLNSEGPSDRVDIESFLASEAAESPEEVRQRFRKQRALLGLFREITTPPPAAKAPSVEDVREFCKGRYQVERIHEAGGLGVVYVARDKELDRQVAVKGIRPELVGSEEHRGRFHREASITGALEHPGIVPVHGLGADDGGQPYYAMKFIEGEKLSDIIERFHQEGHRFPASADVVRMGQLRELLSDFIRVCETIAFAHSRGVIHRDIKPDNIRVGQYGEVLVLDWGLAKHVDSDDALETATEPTPQQRPFVSQAGSGVGTPLFMSPEQAAGGRGVGPASDIYSLGATLHQILTGKPCVEGQSSGEVKNNLLNGRVLSPRDFDQEIPGALDAICRKALNADASRRYPTAQAFADDVQAWIAQERVAAWNEPWSVTAQRWVRRHSTVAAGFAAAVLVGVVSLAIATTLMYFKDQQLQGANDELRGGLYQSQVVYAQSLMRDGEQELALDVLGQCDPQQRSVEWNHLRRQLGDYQELVKEKLAKVRELETSPDGSLIAVAGELPRDKDEDRRTAVFVFDAETGSEIQSFRYSRTNFSGVWFDKDSRYIAVAGSFTPSRDKRTREHGVRLYEVITGELIWSADGERQTSKGVGFVRFGEESDFYTTSGPVDGDEEGVDAWTNESWKLHRWRVSDGKAIEELPEEDPRFSLLEVFQTKNGGVQLRRRLNKEVVRDWPMQFRYTPSLGVVEHAAHRQDAVVVATKSLRTTGNVVRAWHSEHWGKEFDNWITWPHETPIHAVALNSDGSLAASVGDHFLQVWDIKKQRLLLKVATQAKHLTSVRFVNSDRAVAAAGDYSGVRVWKIDESPLSTLTHADGDLATNPCVCPQTGQAIVANRSKITVWDIARREIVRQWKMPIESAENINNIQTMAVNRDGTRLAIGYFVSGNWGDRDQNLVALVDLTSGKLLGQTEAASGFGFVRNAEGLLAIRESRGLYETLKEDFLEQYQDRFTEDRLDRIRYNERQGAYREGVADSRTVAERLEEDLGPASGWMAHDLMKNARGHLQFISLADLKRGDSSNPTRLFLRGSIPKWPFPTRYEVKGSNPSLRSPLVLNRLGAVLAVHTDLGIEIGPVPGAEILSDTATNAARSTWGYQNRRLISDHERRLMEHRLTAVESNGPVKIGRKGFLIERPRDKRLFPLAFSQDTHLLAGSVIDKLPRTDILRQAGLGKCEIRIWDTKTWDSHNLKGHTRWITHAVFSSDNQRLFTSSRDGTVKLWDVRTGNLLLTWRIPARERPHGGKVRFLGQWASLLHLTADDSWLTGFVTSDSSSGGSLLRWDLRPLEN